MLYSPCEENLSSLGTKCRSLADFTNHYENGRPGEVVGEMAILR